MSTQAVPSDAPPSYNDATASSSSSRPQAGNGKTSVDHLAASGSGSGSGKGSAIPSSHRRSMEDESRPLPAGWVRTYDPSSHHQFFVDTTKDPPRSIWIHPYDDDEYLSTLSGEERERIEHESMGRGKPSSKADIMAEHTDDDDDHHHSAAASSGTPAELPPRPEGKPSFGRRWKDKLTGSTHEEREAERKRRAEQEQKAYEQHLRIRQAMSKAAETGQPQLLGKDKDGKDVYVEPPQYDGGYGYGGGYGYNPYGNNGLYAPPNSRYIRPQAPYGRPYGYGYGGGYGLPLALGGGLFGGLLLGDLAFGGF